MFLQGVTVCSHRHRLFYVPRLFGLNKANILIILLDKDILPMSQVTEATIVLIQPASTCSH